MNYKDVDELLKNNQMDQKSFLSCVEFLELNVNNKSLPLFAKLLRYFKIYYESSIIVRIFDLINKFKDVIPYNGMNAAYINYIDAALNYIISDYNGCLEASFKTRDLKDVSDKFRIYTECFLVSSLIYLELYKEAYEENYNLLNSLTYELVSTEYKIVVNMNMVIILIFLNEYNNANKYLKDIYKMKQEIVIDPELDLLCNLCEVLMKCKFEGTYFNKNECEKALDLYVKLNINFDELVSFTENSIIHIEILKFLLAHGRKKDAYNLSKQYVDYKVNDLVDYRFFGIYKDSLEKGSEEYYKALEKYNAVLLKKINHDSQSAKNFYTRYKRLNKLDTEFDLLRDSYQHDPLTKVLSRAKFEEDKEICDYKSLIYIDVNKLKKVNDTYGHAFGDKYLTKFAQNLSSIFKDDYVYRIGGDEFVVISNLDNEIEIAQALKEVNILPLYGTSRGDKFAAGVYINKDYLTVQEASQIADETLYEVKRTDGIFYDFCK